MKNLKIPGVPLATATFKKVSRIRLGTQAKVYERKLIDCALSHPSNDALNILSDSIFK